MDPRWLHPPNHLESATIKNGYPTSEGDFFDDSWRTVG
jgi:hypothetical protein